MGQAGPATRGQVRRKARRSGQIRSESPGPPEPILAAVHPEPPQRHTHKSVDTRVGVRTRSDQAVTLDAALSAVHVSPENRKVVRPRGSQRGSRPHMTSGAGGCQGTLLYFRAVPCAASAARVVAVRISSSRTDVRDRSALDCAARW